MRPLIAQHDFLEQQITEAEAQVAGLLDGELAWRLRTIPGVGPAIVATLIAEIVDIHRFDDFDKLVAYVGVHPAERSSGRKGADPATSWHMAKTGNAYLRAFSIARTERPIASRRRCSPAPAPMCSRSSTRRTARTSMPAVAAHTEALQRADVAREADVARGADVGFAFDGDGDRMMTVDEAGTVHDGDFVLALAARHFARAGTLDPKVVIGTVMTNGGLEATFAREGIALVRTQVGDRYVWEELERRGAQFGGEPSGHVIFREHASTGDRILTALQVSRLMRAEGWPLAALAAEVEHWPQITRNVRAERRREWRDVAPFRDAVAVAEARLAGAGRLVVRPSGTEPVLRITVEARENIVATATAETLEAAATEYLN